MQGTIGNWKCKDIIEGILMCLNWFDFRFSREIKWRRGS